MNVINIEKNKYYLINEDLYNSLKRNILKLDNKILNGELLIENNYPNIDIVNPKYIDNKIIEKLKAYDEIYIINLGMNYISYFNDKIVYIANT